MIARRVLIDNEGIAARYKQRFAYCEACAILNATYPVNENLELHHIFGGADRTDETWNFITLCHEHHARATTHNIRFGSDSWKYNLNYLAIKLVKRELPPHALSAMDLRLGKYANADDLWNAIVSRSNAIAQSDGYRRGLVLGWFSWA